MLAIMNRNGWLSGIPVIIVSFQISNSDPEHAYNLGDAENINRPFYKMTVRHRIENTVKLYAKQKCLENIVTNQIFEKITFSWWIFSAILWNSVTAQAAFM